MSHVLVSMGSVLSARQEIRLRILILAFVARNDPDAAVKRVASNVWPRPQ